MKSPPKVETLSSIARSEWRRQMERENAEDLWAYKREYSFTVVGLATHLGCSLESVKRYLSGDRPVPGYIVSAIRGGKVAA